MLLAIGFFETPSGEGAQADRTLPDRPPYALGEDHESEDRFGLIVSGHSSTLMLANPWRAILPFVRSQNVVCSYFSVQPKGEVLEDLTITSTGVGRTYFWIADANGGQSCPEESFDRADLLAIDHLEERIFVGLKVGPLDLPRGINFITGEVILRGTADAVTRLPVRIERQAWSGLETVGIWFFSILVTSVLTGIAGYIVWLQQQSWLDRRRQWAAFRALKLENHEDVTNLFRDVSRGIYRRIQWIPRGSSEEDKRPLGRKSARDAPDLTSRL